MTIGCVSCGPVTISDSVAGRWVLIGDGPVPLRSWWATPPASEHEIDTFLFRKRAVIVLPEVFGVNAWLRSITDRLAARRHKDATTAAQILADVSAAILWLQRCCPAAEVMVVGFCFGGHAALLAATLPDVVVTLDFYGAGVSRFRPGGGEPTLALMPHVKGRLTCLFGLADPLIPEDDRLAVAKALRQVDPLGDRLRMELFPEADHGFMCDARGSFQAAAAERGWALMLEAAMA